MNQAHRLNDREAIAHYGAGMLRAQDRMGIYQNQLALYRALLPNTTPTIAMLTAQAAVAVADVIRGRTL